jgi:hypothetical protein
MNYANIENGVLILSSGSDYYDTNHRIPVSDVIGLCEEVGVRGGHVGWGIKVKDNNAPFRTISMGRKERMMMDEVKDLIESGAIKADIETIHNQPQKGY